MKKKPYAFVLMPFAPEFDDVYRIGIKEAASKAGFVADRVDYQQYMSQTILERIQQQILYSDVIISDMTGKNPNVFYEVGYAHAKEKPCILLTQSADDIPFDLKHHRHIVYEKSLSSLRTKLIKELQWLRKHIKTHANAFDVRIESYANINWVHYTMDALPDSQENIQAIVNTYIVINLY